MNRKITTNPEKLSVKSTEKWFEQVLLNLDYFLQKLIMFTYCKFAYLVNICLHF